MDDEFRVFILEGLSAKGMKKLEELTKILEPNTFILSTLGKILKF
jgi:hypothetical protein